MEQRSLTFKSIKKIGGTNPSTKSLRRKPNFICTPSGFTLRVRKRTKKPNRGTGPTNPVEGTEKNQHSSESSVDSSSQSSTESARESSIESEVPMDSDSDSPIPISNKTNKEMKKKKSRRSRRCQQRNKNRKRQEERDTIRKENDVTIQNMYDNRTMGIPSVQEQRKRSEQGAIDICMKHFGFYTDPKYTIKDNIRHLILTHDPLNLPRKPRNLKIHNLCTDQKALSKEILETLGLNLGHGIAMPIKKTNPIDFERLRRTIRLKYVPFPPEDPNNRYNPKLRVASLWNPPDAPKDVEDAIDMFEKAAKVAFQDCRKKPPITNMKKRIIDLLKQLKKDRKYIIIAADKNLGPCILDIELYISRCLGDHLDNTDIYEKVSTIDAMLIQENNFRWICAHFIDTANEIPVSDRKFFRETLVGDRDVLNKQHLRNTIEFAYFYAMPKMHKNPWATRPVVSGICSVLEPLSKWLDVQLQRIVHLCPCYLKDSWHFLNDIKKLGKTMKGYKLVISDANAMYTNINTDHAIDTLRKWFKQHEKDLPSNFQTELILKGIERLMKHNVFTFGDRYYLQKNGTAMGTNVACMYATIYYSYHEENSLLHLSYIKFYRRLIDDAFIIVEDTPEVFKNVSHAMDDFGPVGKRLTWKTEKPKDSVDFLDLTISILEDGTINTKTFQKENNPHLYRTPFSSQPPSIIKAFIYGALLRYFWQNSTQADYDFYVNELIQHLLDRGHKHSSLAALFLDAGTKVVKSKMPNPTLSSSTKSKEIDRSLLIIHLPYHANNPTKTEMRTLTDNFKCALNETKSKINIERILTSFSKAPNIGELCKKHRLEPTVTISKFK